MTEQKKQRRKSGFTMVELIVTLVIMGILFAIAVPNLTGYIHLSQFRKNQSYAKTMYLSAESALTYYRTGGEWDDFSRKVQREGVLDNQYTGTDSRVGRIYGIRLEAGEYAQGDLDGDGALVDELLSVDTYDKSILNNAICIEIDISTGQVYSVFYGTACKGLYYESNADSKPATASGKWLDMDQRDYDTRRAERLGYYSVQDVTNVVNLDTTKLSITSINLVNSETLSLNWSSNSKSFDRDIRYEIKFYNDTNKKLLLSMELDRMDPDVGTTSARLNVTKQDGTTGKYTFPLEYDQASKRFSLTLDGMMSAELYRALEKNEGNADVAAASSTSITRFGGDLAAPQRIYATIQAFPNESALANGGVEYRQSEPMPSNTANSMFGDGTSADAKQCEVAAFRHLSNIRYMISDTETTFAVTARSLDWNSDSVKVYQTLERGAMTAANGGEIGFPSIPALRSKQTVDGNSGFINRLISIVTGGNAISNLKLDDTSFADNAEYLGLFQTSAGKINDLRLLNPQVEVVSDTLKGVGAVCGYNSGSMNGTSIGGSAVIAVELRSNGAQGIGGVIGAADMQKSALELRDLSATGKVTGTLPESSLNRGIGGIVGSLTLKNAIVIGLENKADVTGNRSVGGIAGCMLRPGGRKATGQDATKLSNEGLILSSQPASNDKDNYMGHYIGGITGYAENIMLGNCTSRAGYADGYEYDPAKKNSLLLGRYVGGIVGYCQNSALYTCSTKAGGYVLGGEYVGGIIGGTSNQTDTLLREQGDTAVTTNASYVIGNSYVGGIVGVNEGASKITNCVNTGVVAGYNAYIGGIAGANRAAKGSKPQIINCASYVSDTNNAIYQRVTGWGAIGSYAGGLTGYNSGEILFNDTDNLVSTRSVASIVVGKNYVGGLVGYNDTEGEIDVDYTLIGGRVSASGDCVGGLIGLNASAKLLENKLEIKPNSVQGRYYVGGAIGANVVNPTKNITINNIKVNNSLGTVTAEAFCGGLIGYQRTYTEADRAGENLYALLPQIEEGNTPSPVTPSTNSYSITITADGNTNTTLKNASNNMTIRAYAYAGGIVGYCEAQTKMYVKNCLNAGDFDRPADGMFPNSSLQNKVDVVQYLRQSYVDAADALQSELGTGNELRASIIGGVVGVNGMNHVIDHCGSTGTMNGLDAMGGVVGLNEGLIKDCTLSGSMGSATQDYIGGIAGLNVGSSSSKTYGSGTNAISYVAGTILNCTTDANRTVTGRNTVGGIVGYNMKGGIVQSSVSNANVSGTGKVGGIAGENGGEIALSSTETASKRRVNGAGIGVGGVIGVNTATGTLKPAANTTGDVVAADQNLTVIGNSKVGGIAGINRGTLGGTEQHYLTNQATLVRAAAGMAGGIVGSQEGTNISLTYAKNLGAVTANAGAAGGIVALNQQSNTVDHCIALGSVTSNDGYAGGVVSENYGTISSSTVGGSGAKTAIITRNSAASPAAGAVCAINRKGGVISGSKPDGAVSISGNAVYLGAVVGDNYGTVSDTGVTVQPSYAVSSSTLTVGGAVGINREGAKVQKIQVQSDFEDFSTYSYLGGVVGVNCAAATEGTNTTAAAEVRNCTYSGKMKESKSAVGNCYGGIVGLNRGKLTENTVSKLQLEAKGVYTATSTSSAAEKERLSSHIGGIAGKNEANGVIQQCYIDDNGTSTISVENGMVGGVTGYNKGTITQSGDKSTETLMKDGDKDVDKISVLLANAKNAKLSADDNWVAWQDGKQVEDLQYNGGSAIKNGRTMQIIVSSNGNLGGVAGYNAPTGEMSRCVSGNWLLVNKSDSISVGTGGMIGMNESEKDLSYLVNRAFVGRQLSKAATSRFAGGIIGTQSNKTTNTWTIKGCINYGTVYGYRSHYSGGIVGQWTNNGGTIEQCYNYGNMQTTMMIGWVGASAGVVAQLYHASSNQDFNILSCQNHGSLYGRTGKSNDNSANDSAGILGNVTAYNVGSGTGTSAASGAGQSFTINVVDCVNGPGVEIYSYSMASGIVGFFSVDNIVPNEGNGTACLKIGAATENIVLNIDRCRNYAQTLSGRNFRAGIFGDRYIRTSNGDATTVANNTFIQNCYSVSNGGDDYSIVGAGNSGGYSINNRLTNAGNNYYFGDTWGLTNTDGNTITYNSGVSRGSVGESRRGYSRMLAYGEFDGKFYAAIAGPRLEPNLNINQNTDKNSYKCSLYYNMTRSNTWLDHDVLNSEFSDGQKKITGRVLFEMPSSDYGYATVINWGASNLSNAIKQKSGRLNSLSNGKILDDYVREGYRTMEHGQENSKLKDTFSVDLTQNESGDFKVSIKDDDRPLYYEGQVLIDNQVVLSNLRFVPREKGQGQWDPTLNGAQSYGSGETTGTFQLPEELESTTAGKTIELRVRAVSLFEDTEPSEWKSDSTDNVSVLPRPDVSLRLVNHWTNSGTYRVTLNNYDDYAAFNDWKVTLKLGSQTAEINAKEKYVTLNGDDMKELIVIASAGKTNGIQPASVTVTIPTDTPHYTPDGRIGSLEVSYSGNTVDDFTITAALRTTEDTMETPPIYRIEVLGSIGTKEYVFAYEDVLTSAGNAVTANFRDLPEQYFAENVKNRRIRAWYAESGLGPVYTYGDTEINGEAAVTLLTYTGTNTKDEKTIYSYVLGHRSDFSAYIKETSINVKPLAAPTLGTPPKPTVETDGSMYYVFPWTQPDGGTDTSSYSVKLTGITASGARIGIPTGAVYEETDNGVRTFKIKVNADDWNYTKVELTVTRLGQNNGEVGLSSTKQYDVLQRLERPGQPIVTNPDTNELEYTIAWSRLTNETGCKGYQIYVQHGDTVTPLGEMVSVKGADEGASYSVKRDLSGYMNQYITIYLVAEAQDDSGYEDSPNGVSYSMTVPSRIATPAVTWSYNWNETKNNPIDAANFKSGGLVVTVTPGANSTPPGGSTYLLRATITLPDGSTAQYPVSAMSESGGTYVYNLTDLETAYAGCQVQFEARISQSAGQVSSAWVKSGVVTFPRVKLEAPKAALSNPVEKIPVHWGQAGALINAEEWEARLSALTWSGVENAEQYAVTLTDSNQNTTNILVDMREDSPKITVNGQNVVVDTENNWYTVKQGSAVTEQYSTTSGAVRYYSYQLDTWLRVEEDGTFTLHLPNVYSMVTHDNQTLQMTSVEITDVTITAQSTSDRYVASEPTEREFS